MLTLAFLLCSLPEAQQVRVATQQVGVATCADNSTWTTDGGLTKAGFT